MIICENTLEQAIIEELQNKGYDYIYGSDLVRDYSQVILEDYFRPAIKSINDGITDEMISEALRVVKDPGLLNLEQLNEAFHKLLIEGIPVSYHKDGELRTYTVKLVDFTHPEKNDFKVINQYTVVEYKTNDRISLFSSTGSPWWFLN